MNFDLVFYWKLLLRRLPIMALIASVFAGLGLAYALTAPPKFEASATLLVESAQIPDELAASTVTTPSTEQLQLIEQSIRRRDTLLDLANTHGVFEGGERISPDEVVSAMRAMLSVNTRAGRNRATQVEISFESGDAQVSAAIVNDLTNLVLSEDSSRRRSQAGQTLQFFEQEVQRLSDSLSEASLKIVEYKEANSEALPENAEFLFGRQERLLDIIRSAQVESAGLQTQRSRLIELGTTAFSGNAAPRSPTELQLLAAEAELEEAQLLFSENNPRIQVLQARVDALAARLSGELGATTGAPVDPTRAVLDLQLTEVDDQLQRLQNEIANSQRELVTIEEKLDRVPEVRIELEALEREYSIIEGRYNRAVNSLSVAQTGDRIESLSKGQRIIVLEQAVPPAFPTSPNRRLLAGGGVFLGVAFASAFFIIAEVLNRSIRRPADIVSGLGIQPLATIPYLETPGAARRRRLIIWTLVALGIIGVPSLVWSIHEFVTPLDAVIQRIVQRLGLA